MESFTTLGNNFCIWLRICVFFICFPILKQVFLTPILIVIVLLCWSLLLFALIFFLTLFGALASFLFLACFYLIFLYSLLFFNTSPSIKASTPKTFLLQKKKLLSFLHKNWNFFLSKKYYFTISAFNIFLKKLSP